MTDKHFFLNKIEFLPISPTSFNNCWKLRINQKTGKIKIIRSYKFSLFFGAILLPSVFFTFGIFLFINRWDKLSWDIQASEIHFLGVVSIMFGCFFSVIIPLAIHFGINRDKQMWPNCRFSYCPVNGKLIVNEYFIYHKKEYKEIALGIVSGTNTIGSHVQHIKIGNKKILAYIEGKSNPSVQFYLFIFTSKNIWQRHLLALESSTRYIRKIAKLLSNRLDCKVIESHLTFQQSFNNKQNYDLLLMKNISTTPSLYIGTIHLSDKIIIHDLCSHVR
ncbi:MAG: hypothetical protein LBE13_14240 [Bacteroidales bacterium]|jgi:hypothetical protein|nr:hypothetical protein [Bacteroidales bacterium]